MVKLLDIHVVSDTGQVHGADLRPETEVGIFCLSLPLALLSSTSGKVNEKCCVSGKGARLEMVHFCAESARIIRARLDKLQLMAIACWTDTVE